MVTSGLSISIALMLTPAAEPRSFSSPPSGSFCEPLLSSGLATVVAPHHLSPFNLQYYKIDSFGTYFFIRNMPFLPQYFLSHSFIWRCFILRSPICCRTVGVCFWSLWHRLILHISCEGCGSFSWVRLVLTLLCLLPWKNELTVVDVMVP